MTAACRESCCSATPRNSVSELFERGYRRNRLAPLPIEGPPCADTENNSASFSLDLDNGRLGNVGFRASSCTTLIAYCQLIAEAMPGYDTGIAAAMSPQQLVDAVPGVPPLKRGRAWLAIAAFRAALEKADVSIHASTRAIPKSQHERL